MKMAAASAHGLGPETDRDCGGSVVAWESPSPTRTKAPPSGMNLLMIALGHWIDSCMASLLSPPRRGPRRPARGVQLLNIAMGHWVYAYAKNPSAVSHQETPRQLHKSVNRVKKAAHHLVSACNSAPMRLAPVAREVIGFGA